MSGLSDIEFDGGSRASKFPLSAYGAWGRFADLARSQGFYPETDPINGATSFRNNYDKAFNEVIIPNQKEYGYLAAIGNDNQKFNIVIKDKSGNIFHTIAYDQTPDEVQKYFGKNGSVVDTRQQYVAQNTPAMPVNNLPMNAF